jgi:peptidoglycan/xylan/chitin deacetylase (PgdA/CDA1 family)
MWGTLVMVLAHPAAIRRNLARRTVCRAAVWSGYCSLAARFGAGGGRILCYHSITPAPHNRCAVSTRAFLRQMMHLAGRYHVVPVAHLVKLIKEEKPIPPKTVAITIDDGFQDAYTHAYPILAQLGLPATIFILADTGGSDEKEGRISDLPQPGSLSWKEILDMSRHGIDVGSHGMTHASLRSLSPGVAQYELERSREIIESKLGKSIEGFAYPYGTFRDFDDSIIKHVEATGYEWAVSTISGLNTHRTSPYALRRVAVLRDDQSLFERILQGALDPWVGMQWLGRFLRD